MIITRKQLSTLIENYLIVEAVHDKVAAQFGITDLDKIEQLRIASEKPHKLQKPELLWIAKYFTTQEGSVSKEPIEDIVASIKSLKQNRAALARRGSASRLTDYDTPDQINVEVSLSRGFVHHDQISGQADILFEDDNWKLYMPHTREASCTIGRGTSWCTAIPGSGNNLFYNYVISGHAILYYLVKKNPDPKDTAGETHFSLGTLGGKIIFPKSGSGGGGIVVDGRNDGLTKERFLSNVGDALGKQLISIIENHSKANENLHPGKNKVMQMLKNPKLYIVEMRGKSIDVKFDFTALMLSVYSENYNSSFLDAEAYIAAQVALTDPNSELNQEISKETALREKDIKALNDALNSDNDEEIEKFGKVFSDAGRIRDIEHDAYYESGKDFKGYNFCKGMEKLEDAVPFYLYSKVENIAKSYDAQWKNDKLIEFEDEFFALDKEEEILKEVAYSLEVDAATTSSRWKFINKFCEVLLLYHTNLLLHKGYALIHDPQVWSKNPDWYAGNAVQDFDDYMSNSRQEVYWIKKEKSNMLFSAEEILGYIRKNYSAEFFEWCVKNGFDFMPRDESL